MNPPPPASQGTCGSTANVNAWNGYLGKAKPNNLCGNPWSGSLNLCDRGPSDCEYPEDNKDANCVGDPVDLTTGQLERSDIDVDLGRGLAFRRHYQSDNSATAASPLGLRWRHDLAWSLQYAELVAANGAQPQVEIAMVRRPFGGVSAFQRVGGATGSWNGGAYGTGGLTGSPSTGFVHTDREGTAITFTSNATTPPTFSLAQIQRPGEPAIAVTTVGSTTTYASAGTCLAVTTSAGLVTSVTSRTGPGCTTGSGDQTWSYTYNGGCLATVSGPNLSGGQSPVTWTYSYDMSGTTCTGRLKKVQRQVGSAGPLVTLAQWTWANGKVTAADEPALDQPLTMSYGSTSGNTITTVTDGSATLATFTSRDGRILTTTGQGGPGVDVPFASATFTSATSTGAPANLWKTKTDVRGPVNGYKALYESHDSRGRAGRITEGWKDSDNDNVLDATETYARRRDFTYHPRLPDALSITEMSVLKPADSRVVIYDYDSDLDSMPNEEPTDLLHQKVVQGWTLDASGSQVPFTDVTTYSYDSSNRLTAIAGPRAANLTTIDYDATSGSRSSTRRYLDGPSSVYLEWTFSSFDARGNPQTVTDPNGRSTAFTYDTLGRVLTATPPYTGAGSSTTSFTYDVDGNLTRVDFPADTAGNPVFLRMGYDAKSNLLFLADSQANAIVYEYQKNRATREARYTGFVDYTNRGTLAGDANFSFDAAGRIFRAFNPLFGGGTVYSELDHDAKGNPTGIEDENGREDVLLYDALDRLTEIQQLRSLTYETAFAYDTASHVIAVTDAAGKTTDLLHDDRGYLVETVSPDTGTTRFLTDEAGNLAQKIEDAGGVAERVTSYEYDGLDRLLEIDLPSDPDWVFTYDTSAALHQKGRLASVTNGVVTTELEYTQRGDVAVERTILDGLSYEVTHGYDAAGNRTSIEGPSGSRVETSYSGLRPSQLDVIAGAASEEIQDLAWFPFGPRTQAKFPPEDGSGDNTVLSTRAVNLRGQIEELDVIAASGAILDRSYLYAYTAGSPGPTDPGPNVDQLLDHLDASESRFYFYDELDRLAAAKTLAGTTLHAYGYDAVGNRTSKQGPLGTSAYSYQTATDRLDAATGAEARDYAHDAYGNRVYEGVAAFAGTPSLVYDDANRLIEAKNPAASFATLGTYVYDAFGRRVKKVAGGKTVLFFYDGEGHLVEEVEKVASGDDRARLYVFLEDELVGLIDREGEFGAAQAPLGIWLPLDLAPGLAVLFLALAAGAVVALVTRRLPAGVATAGSGVGLLLVCASGSSGPVLSWVHTDPLGTPLAVTGTPVLPADADAIWRASHEPFGLATTDEDPDGDSVEFALQVRFPGQYEDAETGWHYNRFRDFDPLTGRYLEPDPLGFNNTFNIYSYVDADPINYYDTTGRGRTGLAVGGAIGGAIGTAVGGLAGGGAGAVGGGLATAGGGAIPIGVAGATWGALEGGIVGTAIGAVVGSAIEDAIPAIPIVSMSENVGDSAIERDFGAAAAEARLRGCSPPDRCEWLAEQAAQGLYSPERVRTQAKKWGCRGSRFFKGGKSR